MNIDCVIPPGEADFIFEWADHWFQFADLIFQSIKPNEEGLPPSKLDSDKHGELRLWLVSHEQQLTYHWKRFYSAKLNDLEPDSCLIEYWQNPFAYFYQPENLPQLAVVLHLQETDDHWQPNPNNAWEAAITLINVGSIAVEFYKWVSDEKPG